MTFRKRVSRLERICKSGSHDTENVQVAEHDSRTGDHLLRIWEGGADDWVCRAMEGAIGRVQGLVPEATTCLQERLKILQTGDPLEVLLVIARLSRDCPGWSSVREDDVIEASIKDMPAIGKAVTEYGILHSGRKDWRKFVWWFERRVATGLATAVADPNRVTLKLGAARVSSARRQVCG